MNKIIIAGAGAIGNYIGIQLNKNNFNVVFLGSSRVVEAEKKFGITLEYPDNTKDSYAPSFLSFTTDPACCSDADLILVTVKSLATEKLIQQMKPFVGRSVVLLTLQNGISNAKTLKDAFPNNPVFGGMVTFNVIEKIQSTFKLTTSGEIYLEKSTLSLQSIFQQTNMVVKELDNMESILWAKLLLNLINPLNALSGKSLKQNLEDREFRLQWAECMREGLAALRAAGIKPAKVTPLPTHFLPFMVSLPNWIYLTLAKKMTDMDPDAKSSMAQDLEKGNKSEIDYLNGEIIKLGKKTGVKTVMNEKIYAAIREVENGRSGGI